MNNVSIRHLENTNKHTVKTNRKQKYNLRYILVVKTANKEEYLLNEEARDFIADALVEVNESLTTLDIDDIYVSPDNFRITMTHYEPTKTISIAVNKIKTLLGRRINKHFDIEIIEEEGEEVEYLDFGNFKAKKGELWTLKDYYCVSFNEAEFIQKSIKQYLDE